jgi:ectoine hydroxylase-related dioxygenase (phytanoyl-CoA dioxygenase family)
MHCDAGFFTRKSEKVLTCWLVFTDITIDKGPLFIIEGSHKYKDILQKFKGFDVDLHKDKKATIDKHPVQFAQERNTKILTADFKPGDALIFGMYTVHGTFENHAKDQKIRLTCDVRYQPENEPKDPRYFGNNPTGTTGAGYAELNSARPLNEDWHTR